MAPYRFEPDRGEPFHVVCTIQYQKPRASKRILAARGYSTAAAELRDDLARLRIPSIKPENIMQHEIYDDTLELWWWHQRGCGPLHNTLEKVLCRNMEPSDIAAEQILCIELFYLPEHYDYLPPTWKPWWQLEARSRRELPLPSRLSPSPSTSAPTLNDSSFSAAAWKASATLLHPHSSASFPVTASLSVEEPPLASGLPPSALGISLSELQYCFRLLDGAHLMDLDWGLKASHLEIQLGRLFQGRPLPSFISDTPSKIRDAILAVLHARAERVLEIEHHLRIASNYTASIVPAAETRERGLLRRQSNDEKLDHSNLLLKFDKLCSESEENRTALSEASAETERLTRQLRILEAHVHESKAKLAESENARTAAQTKESVAENKLAVARSKQETAEATLAALLPKFTKQDLILSTVSKDKDRLQSELNTVEEERRKERGVHAQERRHWEAEQARMRTELDAMRAEQTKSFVTPALLNALIGVDDMVHFVPS